MKKLIVFLFLAISFASFSQTDSTKPNKRPIDKVKVWANGVVYDASDIDVVCVWDDLSTTARFYYVLADSVGAVVSSGNVEIKGDKYRNYATLANHADRAVVMVMRELNVKQRATTTTTTTTTKTSTTATVTNQ